MAGPDKISENRGGTGKNQQIAEPIPI